MTVFRSRAWNTTQPLSELNGYQLFHQVSFSSMLISGVRTMFLKFSVLVFVVCVSIGDTCSGGVIQQGRYTLRLRSIERGYGNGNGGRPVEKLKSNRFTFGAGMTVDESISTSLITTDFLTGIATFNGQATVNVNGTFTNDNHKLRFDLGLSSEVTGTATGLLDFVQNGVSATITTQWEEQDSFFLRSRGTGSIVPSSYFPGGFNLRYKYDIKTGVTNGVNGYANLDFNYTSRQFDLLGVSTSFTGFVDTQLNWTNNRVNTRQSGGVGLNWSFDGSRLSERGFIDGRQTVELTSLTFADGTTPESHGFDVVFESGRSSPNLAVPEPSSFTICALFILSASLAGLRRRPPHRVVQPTCAVGARSDKINSP